MPITKERLLTIINAAEHIENTYNTTAQRSLQHIARVRAGRLPPEKALELIEYELSGHELIISAASKAILIERTRWNLTHSRNDRERARQQRHREEQGIRRLSSTAQHSARTFQRQATLEYLRQMESFGYTPEEALDIQEGRLPSRLIHRDEQPNTQPSPFIEDSDQFDIPDSDTINE